jgi:hypothetical protein
MSTTIDRLAVSLANQAGMRPGLLARKFNRHQKSSLALTCTDLGA